MDADLLAMLGTFNEKYTYSYRSAIVRGRYTYTTDELTFAENLGQIIPNLGGLLIVVAVGEDVINGTRIHSEQPVCLDTTTVSLPGDVLGGQIHT
jgi:hypothetical protein